MKIGTDISLQVCRDEGYLVMEVDKRAFNKAPTTTDCEFTMSLPLYYRKETGWKVGDPIVDSSTTCNYKELYASYTVNKIDIDQCCGCDHEYTETPTVYDVLNIASDVCSYKGLD